MALCDVWGATDSSAHSSQFACMASLEAGILGSASRRKLDHLPMERVAACPRHMVGRSAKVSHPVHFCQPPTSQLWSTKMSPFGDYGYNAFLSFLQSPSPSPPPPKTEVQKSQQPKQVQKEPLQKPVQQLTKPPPKQPEKQNQQKEDDGYDAFLLFLQCSSITFHLFACSKKKMSRIAYDIHLPVSARTTHAV